MEQREHFLGKPRELFDGSFFSLSFYPWDPQRENRCPPLNVLERVTTLPGYIKCIFYIKFVLIKILNLFQHIYMCQFSASQHFINHIQNKYQKYMTYIIKHWCIKFTHGHTLSNLKIFIHARVCVFGNGWGKKWILNQKSFSYWVHWLKVWGHCPHVPLGTLAS